MDRFNEKGTKEKQEEMLASRIMEAVRSIEYGHVQITIHNSKVVQIEKTEKIRLRRPRECIC